jgi:phytoene/squalene synthetase
MTTSLSLCGQEIQKVDHDQFLCGLYAPDEHRDDFYALCLFAHETARIRDMVKEPHLGLIRLQWWRDVVEAVYTDRQDHSENGTHKEFVKTLQTKTIDKGLLDRYLNARAFDMEDQTHDDLPALMRYLEATGGSINHMKACFLNPDTMPAAQKIGTAQALCDVIKTLPYQARSGKCKIPVSLRKKHQLDLKAFHDFQPSNALQNCISELADEIIRLIAEARTEKAASNAALLSTVAIEDYLKRLKKLFYDPFNPHIGGGRLARQIKLILHGWRGSY